MRAQLHRRRIMPLVGKNRLTKAQNDKLRGITRTLLTERYDSVGTKLAEALDVSQPTLSRFLSGVHGTTDDLAHRILLLAGLDGSALGLDAPPDSGRRPNCLPLSQLPGWEPAEQIARRLYKHVPEAAWLEARSLAAVAALTLTPDVVAHLALACDASHDADRRAS
jgi:transcriptional regulator with XRE-family HTH domain